MAPSPRLERLFAAIIARRVAVVVIFALLLPLGAWGALLIPQDDSIDRLVVETDPDYIATRDFQQVFPEPRIVMLVFSATDPYTPTALAELMGLEAELQKIPEVRVNSALSVWRRTHPTFAASAEESDAFRKFATGTELFRRQGLLGDGFISLATLLTTETQVGRNQSLDAIDVVLAKIGTPESQWSSVRRVGRPYVERFIQEQMRTAYLTYLPLFVVFVIALILALYRSVRTLLAILIALGTSVGLATGVAHLLGYSFTVISGVVPLTILVTCTATLVYLQSRFVERPPDRSIDDHQVFALANKFLPVTASLVAAVLGFAALGVSHIRPVREMGIWIAIGLTISGVVCFTLFPALQKLLATPTSTAHPDHPGALTRRYDAVMNALPHFTYRWRWPLVIGSLVISALGVGAVFGVPGVLTPMRVEIDAIDYIDKDLPLYRDMRHFEKNVAGLAVARVWVKGKPGDAVDPAFLFGLETFSRSLEALPDVSSVLGPTGLLRMRRYLAGAGDSLPSDPEAFAAATADLESLLLTEVELQGFIDIATLGNAHIMVVTRASEPGDFARLAEGIQQAWSSASTKHPSLAKASFAIVGDSVLQAKIGANLVPTLTESFALTALLILVTFIIVFRSGAARLMAMIPSLFAILATFLLMRFVGIPLNVATILIATTVLGTTENDQIHFFYHLQEGKEGNASTERALRHSLAVAGRAIIFATLINAGGFFALALSGLPPIRQFGIVTASAFLLSMLADFTALPAALWIFFREKPDPK